MRIALISDIHGNLRALQSVLADARGQGAQAYLFLGDFIFDMPFSNAVVHTLMGLENAGFVRGNKEGYLSRIDWTNPEGPRREQTAILYQTYRDLDAASRAFLAGLPENLTWRLDSGKTIFCAHTLRDLRKNGRTRFNSSSQFCADARETPFTHDAYLHDLQAFYEREMAGEAREIGADAIAYGHNHLQGYGHLNGRLLVNPGSCGLPTDLLPGAPYTLLEETRAGFHALERRVPYDTDACIREAEHTDCWRKGRIWAGCVRMTLVSGRDCISEFLRAAKRLAAQRGETGEILSNDCMREAFARYMENA